MCKRENVISYEIHSNTKAKNGIGMECDSHKNENESNRKKEKKILYGFAYKY